MEEAISVWHRFLVMGECEGRKSSDSETDGSTGEIRRVPARQEQFVSV